jgi:DNA-binding MarR family transcriptional regulator
MARLRTGVRRRQRPTSYLLAGRLRVSMIHLSRQLRRRDPSELTIAKLSALGTVVQSGPLSVGQLAEIEGLPSPAATRLADKLEEAGLVERRANPEDRRGIHLVATIRGIALLERHAETGTAWLADRLAALNESDHRALERAVTVLEALAAERPGAPEATPVPHDADGGRRGTLKEVSR